MNQHLGRQHQRRFRLLCVPAILAVALAAARPPAAEAATPDQVNTSINKGVKYLYDAQNADGSWELVGAPTTAGGHEVTGKQWGGLTAMATYALLAAGEKEQDARIVKAVNWLGKANIVGTYALGMRAQVWSLLSRNGPHAQIVRAGVQRDAAALVNTMYSAEGESWGWYTYFRDGYMNQAAPAADPNAKPYDRSNSQYGVLGVWGCAQAGAEIPAKYWMVQDQIWKKSQNADGGWEYTGEGPSTHTMAAAGLATLFITEDYLINAAMTKRECRGNHVNKHIDLGLAYMDKNAKEMLTNQGGAHYHYLMYGIERIGVASGRKYFGTLDWYQVGAEALVRQQGGDGGWGAEEPVYNAKKVPSTVFCLMFLVRGRAPVVLNKLEYASAAKEGNSSAAGWNQRPRDAANFAWWMGRQAERFYNWQIVNLKVEPEEFFDAPLLYIAGSETLGFKAEEVAKLKRYVEAGGIILGHADCDKERFGKSFRALGTQMFPNYEFRLMPANHPVYTRQQFSATRWKSRPAVYELSNGVRSLMFLLANGDPARKWQARGGKDVEAFQLGANLFYYATDKNINKFKGVTHVVKDAGETPADVVRVARVQYAGNWDPEPGAWRRLGAILKNDHSLGLELATVKLGDKSLAAADVDVAHLTGTTKFAFNDAQRQEVKAFVEGGGTLVVDAAGGASDFADAAQHELEQMFGKAADALRNSLPVTHPLYALPGGGPLKEFKYRTFTKPKISGKLPRLKGIEVAGRTAVLFSREDLTVGMVGQDVDGIFGYSPETATAIMRKVVLLAKGAKPDNLASAGARGGERSEREDDDGPAPSEASADADEQMSDSEDGEDGAVAEADAGRPRGPVERIEGDIDIQAELADLDTDKGKNRRKKPGTKKKVGKPE